MLVTPDEAGRKTCPLMAPHYHGGITCHADNCMAWRQVGANSGYCGMAGIPLQLAKDAAIDTAKAYKSC